MKYDIGGLTKLAKQMQKIEQAITDGANGAILLIANQIKSEAKDLISNSPRGGKTYKKTGGKIHVASAGGEPPAVDTGKLLNSFEIGLEASLKGYVLANTTYAKHLEFGTSKMQERPFLRPATEKVRPIASNILSRLIKLAIQGAVR